MYQHRPSIMSRPVREQAPGAAESAQAQYEREQAILRQKAQQAAHTQERMIKAIYPMPEDKKAAFQDQQRHLELQRQAKMADKEMAEQQEQVWTKPGNAAARVYVFTEDRPWLNPSMVYSSEAEEKLARRKYEESVAEQNRQFAAEKAMVKAREKSVADEEVRKNYADQSLFWNLGSRPGDRFAPAELRRTSPRESITGPGVPGASQQPPVWAWSAGQAPGMSAAEAAQHLMPPQMPAAHPAYQQQHEAMMDYNSSPLHRPSAGAPFATLSDLERQREAAHRSAAASGPFTMGGGLHGGAGVANCLGFGGGSTNSMAGGEPRSARPSAGLNRAPYACDYQATAPHAQFAPAPELPPPGSSVTRTGRHVRPPHEIARAQYSAPWATDKDPVPAAGSRLLPTPPSSAAASYNIINGQQMSYGQSYGR